MKIHDILTEAIVDVDDDVELLFNKYFSDSYSLVEETGTVSHKWFKKYKTTTDILRSPMARQAHDIHPCEIFINYGQGNFFRPDALLIHISAPFHAIEAIESYGGGNIEATAERLPPDQAKLIVNELRTEVIKGTIHHELSHWIRDTLNNNHIMRTLNRANERGMPAFVRKGDVNAHNIEVDAQIHNIIQLRKKYPTRWDTYTIDDVIDKSPALSSIRTKLIRTRQYHEWKKQLLRRMAREGLLGASMRVER